jgi:hypothetical protein
MTNPLASMSRDGKRSFIQQSKSYAEKTIAVMAIDLLSLSGLASDHPHRSIRIAHAFGVDCLQLQHIISPKLVTPSVNSEA